MNRSDVLVRLFEVLDRRTNYVEEIYDENTIHDMFYPMSERLTLVEEVEVLTSASIWGIGRWGLGMRWGA